MTARSTLKMLSVPKMTFSVTLHVFSGRTNPRWKIDHTHEKYTEILECLGDIPSTTLLPRLGYRGFSIQVDSDPEMLYQNYRTPVLLLANHVDRETMFLQTAPQNSIHPMVIEQAQTVIQNRVSHPMVIEQAQTVIQNRGTWAAGDAANGRNFNYGRDHFSRPVADNSTASAGGNVNVDDSISTDDKSYIREPLYEPEKWNNDQHLTFNSCYNYANDIITDTFAIPGRGTSHKIPNRMNGNDVRDAATFDGVLPVNATDPDHLPAHTWNLIALVFWPGVHPGDNIDYHFYRLDNTDLFSHKPGQTSVVNFDNVGRPIADPRYCNRGPYKQFIGFMQTLKTKIKII